MCIYVLLALLVRDQIKMTQRAIITVLLPERAWGEKYHVSLKLRKESAEEQ